MVLYQAINTYQLLVSILHANKEHSNEKKILLLPNFIVRSIPQYIKMVDYGFFDEILVFNYSRYNGKSRIFILNTLEADFDTLFDQYEIADFTNVYVGAAQYYLSVYLILKGKKFSIIEDGAGLLSRPYLLEETVKNQKVLNVELLEEFGLLYLNNPHIIRKICLIESQESGFSDILAENFDIEYELFHLSTDKRRRLLDFWGCPTYDDTYSDGNLLLTQNFANLNQMSYEDQVLIYQTILDLFCKEQKVLIKPHPNDLMPYEMFTSNNVAVIRSKFPSELLPFIFKAQPGTIYNVSSTGIRLIEKYFDRSVTFGLMYEKTFKKTIAYYMALNVVKHIDLPFEYYGTCDYIINCFSQDRDINNAEILITDVEIKNPELINRFRCIILVDNYESVYFNENIWKNGVLIKEIVKVSTRDEYMVSSLESEFLYFICNDEGMRNSIMNYGYSEKLKNMGIDIEMRADDELRQYINLLKGYNCALEKRLKYYIDLVEEKENENRSSNTI